MGIALSSVDLGSAFIPIDVEAGGDHVCAISEWKAVKCWGQLIHSVLRNMFCSISSMYYGFTGNDDYGQLGHCGWTQQFGVALLSLEFGNGFVPEFMGMGEYHSCFVSTDWSMICFGRNNYGQV